MTYAGMPVDMAGGANVLRCLADFIASRPGLPELVSVHVAWSHTARGWTVKGQLIGSSGVPEIDRWALALDDPVITSHDGDGQYTGPYQAYQVSGTVHGHSVTVWVHLPRGGDR